MSNIQHGFCHCGCGQKTKIAQQSVAKYGWVKGEPRRFINGHQNIQQDIETRFWSKVDRSGGDDACWIWKAGVANTYGRFQVVKPPKRSVNAHRFAWELTYGQIPDGICVLHNCPTGDNSLCCNPKHLFLGTHVDNQADKVQKGRQAKGQRIWSSKLSLEKVAYIRAQYATGNSSFVKLGREMGVSATTIGKIVKNRIWVLAK
jgi:hypothetical protein